MSHRKENPGTSYAVLADSKGSQSLVLVLFSVASVVALILLCSPNFNSRSLMGRDPSSNEEAVRQTPLGSDFVQEWSGAYIWASAHRSKLYQDDHFKKIQHDSDVMGFSWIEDSFYPMVYPPFYYMLLSPLASIKYSTAMYIWMMSLTLILATTIWIWCSYFPNAEKYGVFCLIACLAYYPLLMSLNTAHKSVVLLLLLTASYLLLRLQRPFQSGLVFGLLAFKPHLAILIWAVMALKRQWKFAFGAMSSIGTLIVLSILAGTDICSDYFWQCVGSSNYTSNGGYQLTEAQNIAGSIALMFGTESVVGQFMSFGCHIFAIGAIFVSLRGELDTHSLRFGKQFSLLIVATVLTSPHFYTYDLTVLLLPFGIVCLGGACPNEKRIHNIQKHLILAMYGLIGVSTSVAEATSVQPNFLLTMTFVLAISCELSSFNCAAGYQSRVPAKWRQSIRLN